MPTCNKNYRYEEKFNSLPHDQDGEVRHKSSHAAFAKGYQDGVEESYR